MNKNPDGECQRHDGDGVTGEVDGGRVLADADAIFGRRAAKVRRQRDARPVIAVVGPCAVRLADPRRVIWRVQSATATTTENKKQKKKK